MNKEEYTASSEAAMGLIVAAEEHNAAGHVALANRFLSNAIDLLEAMKQPTIADVVPFTIKGNRDETAPETKG